MTHYFPEYVVQISTPRLQCFSDLPLGTAVVVWEAQENSISALLFQALAKTRTYRKDFLGY